MSVVLYWAAYLPFIVGIVGQIIWRGHFLQWGLTAWPFCRFLAWVLAIPDAHRFGRKRQRIVIANALLWLVIAMAIGLGVNAVLIWGR
ncbi:MAG TPA: hypothetical protein VE968_06135 [Sphingomicrobium sp.]|nr:hypothetical protein [Sphingomicrobium sp.]